MIHDSDITALLQAARGGEQGDLDRLFQAVYQQLRGIAHQRRLSWQSNDTLSTTALVHETYLKLTGSGDIPGHDRGRFFAAASNAMRQILVDYARKRRAAKRGGGKADLSLESNPIASNAAADGVLAVDQALKVLAESHPRQSQVVQCRFFAGLDVPDTAAALQVSAATVKRDWAAALSWLHQELDLANGL